MNSEKIIYIVENTQALKEAEKNITELTKEIQNKNTIILTLTLFISFFAYACKRRECIRMIEAKKMYQKWHDKHNEK